MSGENGTRKFRFAAAWGTAAEVDSKWILTVQSEKVHRLVSVQDLDKFVEEDQVGDKSSKHETQEEQLVFFIIIGVTDDNFLVVNDKKVCERRLLNSIVIEFAKKERHVFFITHKSELNSKAKSTDFRSGDRKYMEGLSLYRIQLNKMASTRDLFNNIKDASAVSNLKSPFDFHWELAKKLGLREKQQLQVAMVPIGKNVDELPDCNSSMAELQDRVRDVALLLVVKKKDSDAGENSSLREDFKCFENFCENMKIYEKLEILPRDPEGHFRLFEKEEIVRECKKMIDDLKTKSSEFNRIWLFVTAHGTAECICDSYGTEIELNELMQPLRQDELKDKDQFLIFDACRGSPEDVKDGGSKDTVCGLMFNNRDTQQSQQYQHRQQQQTYIIFSSIPGFPSYCTKQGGPSVLFKGLADAAKLMKKKMVDLKVHHFIQLVQFCISHRNGFTLEELKQMVSANSNTEIAFRVKIELKIGKLPINLEICLNSKEEFKNMIEYEQNRNTKEIGLRVKIESKIDNKFEIYEEIRFTLEEWIMKLFSNEHNSRNTEEIGFRVKIEPKIGNDLSKPAYRGLRFTLKQFIVILVLNERMNNRRITEEVGCRVKIESTIGNKFPINQEIHYTFMEWFDMLFINGHILEINQEIPAEELLNILQADSKPYGAKGVKGDSDDKQIDQIHAFYSTNNMLTRIHCASSSESESAN